MTINAPAPEGVRRRKRRRRILWFLTPVVLLAIGWPVVERLIDIERYRPMIDKELELLIELPISMGAMDLQLLPTPRLVVEDVVVGEGDFKAFSPKVSVTADLRALFERRLDLRTVTINDLRVQLPESNGDFSDRWGAYMLALNTPDPSTGKPMLKVTLAEITAPNLVILRGEVLAADGTLTVSEVTEGAPQFNFSLAPSGIASEPKAEGIFTLTVDENPVLRGVADVTNLPLATITGDQSVPPFLLSATMEYQLSQDDALIWKNSGTIRIEGQDTDLGPFSMDGLLSGGAYSLTNLDIKTPPLTFLGDLELEPGAAWTLAIAEAHLVDVGVDWLLRFLPDLPFRPSEFESSNCTLEAMRFGENDAGVFEISTGLVHTAGVDLVIDDPDFVLTGLQSMVTISGDTYTLERISSDYLNVNGTVLAQEDGRVALELMGQARLGPNFPLPPSWGDKLRLDGGTIDIPELSIVLDDGLPIFASAKMASTIENANIAMWDRDQQDFVTLNTIGGSISLDDGVLHVTELAAAGGVVNGALTPDEHFDQWAFETSFKSDLTSPFWKPFYPDTQMSIAGGTLECSRVAGIYARSSGEVVELDVEGHATDLRVDLHLADYNDLVHIDSVDIAAEEARVRFGFKGKTDTVGPISGNGEYNLTEEQLTGEFSFRPSVVGKKLLPTNYWDDYGDAILSPLESMKFSLSHSSRDHIITLSSESPIAVSGTIALSDTGTVRDVVLNVSTPANWMTRYVPVSTSVGGLMGLSVQFAPETGVLGATLRLTNAEISWGKIKKPAGLTAEAMVNGTWRNGGLQDMAGHFLFGKREIPFRSAENGLELLPFDVALEDIQGVLPPGSAISGHLSGRASTNPNSFQGHISEARLEPGDPLPTIGLEGTFDYSEGGWSFDGLQLSQGGQVISIAAENKEGPWQGKIHADTLDLDQALADYRALTGWWTSDEVKRETQPAVESGGPLGSILLSADELTWEEATLTAAVCTLKLEGGAQHFSGLVFTHGNGLGRGTISRYDARDGLPQRVELDMVLMSMDLGVIESCFIGTGREMFGAVDGRAVLTILLPDNETSIARGMSGDIEFTARDGSLGKAGLASKFLTALRTTDILRMRIPSLRDKGVTFQALSGSLHAENGVFTLAPFHMEDSTFVLESNVILNYQENTAAGVIQLEILEGVTGVARKIPILGQAANAMNKAFGVELNISGTADEPTFSAGALGPMRTLESGARSLLKGTQKLVGQ